MNITNAVCIKYLVSWFACHTLRSYDNQTYLHLHISNITTHEDVTQVVICSAFLACQVSYWQFKSLLQHVLLDL